MQIWKYLLGSLFLSGVAVWLAIFQLPDKNLHIVACDVGQGDAILAVLGRVQILTDGGPDNKVLDCLAKYLPFWDREIELVILTHPQKDHYQGLIEVFRRYKIDNFLYNQVEVSSQGYEVLEKEVGGSGAKLLEPVGGMKLRLGLLYLDIFSPSAELKSQNSNVKSDKANQLSIVYLLKYDQFEALMTGDIPPEISEQLAARGGIGPVDYIKIPHHGSRNGLTENLLAAIRPKIAVISVGKNSYGHPHEEVLRILRDYNIKILRTDEMGNIEAVSDGEKYWVK